MGTEQQQKLLRLSDVSELTSLGKSTINLWVAQGKFPAPTLLSKTIKVWRYQDIERWIEALAANQFELAVKDTILSAAEQIEASDV